MSAWPIFPNVSLSQSDLSAACNSLAAPMDEAIDKSMTRINILRNIELTHISIVRCVVFLVRVVAEVTNQRNESVECKGRELSNGAWSP